MTNLLRPRLKPARRIAMAALLSLGAAYVCRAQSMLDLAPAEAAAQQSERPSSSANSSSVDGSMPAEGLIRALRNNPEVMVEVKSLIADQAQRQGLSLQPDALTDRQVYSELEASVALRASITQFLRARGYLSESDIEQARETYQNQARHTKGGTRSALRAHDEANAAPGAGEGDQEDFGADKPSLFATARRGAASSPQKAGASRSMDASAPPNITDEPSALHRTAPYNLRALRDLYSQVPDSAGHLKRLGSSLFTNRSTQSSAAFAQSGRDPTLDVPLGPDYVLGPGDELSIALWGGISQTIFRTIDRDGHVSLPEAGPLQVAGLTLGDAQSLIADAMRGQYRNAHVFVTVTRVRSIRIFIVGDVQRPGAYEISALASPLTALFDAGGTTAIGSLRVHYWLLLNPGDPRRRFAREVTAALPPLHNWVRKRRERV